MLEFRECFNKVLSPNDVGVTRSHQAGIVIPKKIIKIGYFPELESGLNPRATLTFIDSLGGPNISANFIYYNSKTLGLGTRNEYRLTGIRSAFKSYGMKINSVIRFGYDGNTQRLAIRMSPSPVTQTDLIDDDVLKISDGWRVIGRFN